MVKKLTQFRGLGVFTSRLPLVWPGGTYNNNGVTQGATNQINAAQMPVFNPNPSVASQLTEFQILLHFQDQVLVT
jgi:hypothetical protein